MTVSVGVAATKMSYFSDRNYGNPTQGESSDILNVEEEKNDYEWFVFVSIILVSLCGLPLFFYLQISTSLLQTSNIFSSITFSTPVIQVPLSLDEIFAF